MRVCRYNALNVSNIPDSVLSVKRFYPLWAINFNQKILDTHAIVSNLVTPLDVDSVDKFRRGVTNDSDRSDRYRILG